MKRSAVIVSLSLVALLFSSAVLARGDEKVRWNPQTVQSAQASSQEALAKLHAEEAVLLKRLEEIRQSMAKALATSKAK